MESRREVETVESADGRDAILFFLHAAPARLLTGNVSYHPSTAGVVKLADARDSKSRGLTAREGSIPSSGTNFLMFSDAMSSPHRCAGLDFNRSITDARF